MLRKDELEDKMESQTSLTTGGTTSPVQIQVVKAAYLIPVVLRRLRRVTEVWCGRGSSDPTGVAMEEYLLTLCLVKKVFLCLKLDTDVREEVRDIPIPDDSAVVMDWRLRVLLGGKEEARCCCFNLDADVFLEDRRP